MQKKPRNKTKYIPRTYTIPVKVYRAAIKKSRATGQPMSFVISSALLQWTNGTFFPEQSAPPQ